MFFQLPSFRFYLNFFQVLGLCPVEFNHSKKLTPKILILISVFHVLLLTLVGIFVYVYSESIFWVGDSLGYFNDIVLYIVVIVAYYAIILESFVKRKTQSKIWSLLARSEQSNLGCDVWNCKEFNFYCIGYFTLFLVIECCCLPCTVERSQSFNYWCLYIMLVVVSRIRHMQYIFYLNIVNRQLQLLFQELKMIESFSKNNPVKLSSPLRNSFKKFLCRRLFLARENYSLIFEISIQINGAFGWSHLINLTHSFVQILTDFYWMYWKIDNEAFMLCGGLFGSFLSVVIVFLVFGYATELNAKAMKVGSFVHSIKQIDFGSRLQNLVESFSLQLLHEPITFHAHGCFVLDLSILGDITVAITTYMAFFMQFTPRYL